MQSVQTTAPHASLDRPRPDPQRKQLPAAHDSVLAAGKLPDQSIRELGRLPAATRATFPPYASGNVDFVGHGADAEPAGRAGGAPNVNSP
jgi:hypothetical protein